MFVVATVVVTMLTREPLQPTYAVASVRPVTLGVEGAVAYKQDESSSSTVIFRSFSWCDTPIGIYV